MGAVLVLEERFIGKFRQLVVVLRVPNTLRRLQIDAGLVAVLHGMGVNGHAGAGHRFTVRQLHGPVDEVLQVVAVSNFDVNALVSVSKRRHVSGSKRSEKHQQHQENWLGFRVCLI